MEKPLFEVETRTTPASCKAIALVRARQHGKTIWLINMVIAIGAAALWAVDSRRAYWITALLAILVLQTIFHIPIAGLLRYLVHKAEDLRVSIAFDSEKIGVHTRSEDSRIPYSEITDWAETRLYYVVMLHNHTPLAIKKAALTPDCAAMLESVLREKTGKVCRQVKR